MKQAIHNIIKTLNEIDGVGVTDLNGNEFIIRTPNIMHAPKFIMAWMGEAPGQNPHFVAYYRRQGISRFPLFSIYNQQEAIDFVTVVRSMHALRCKRFT